MQVECLRGYEAQDTEGPLRRDEASSPIKHHIRVVALFEHLALGAGSYAGLGAIAGREHRWQVGVSGTALMAVVKEASDKIAGRDTTKQSVFHAASILAGVGTLAAFWH